MHKTFFILLFGFLACSTNNNLIHENKNKGEDVNEFGVQYAGVWPVEISKDEIFEDYILTRAVVYRDTKSALNAMSKLGTSSGIVTIKVLVNRQGDIVYVEILDKETTIKSRRNLKDFLLTALNYKIQGDENAPKYQSGKLIFNINEK